MRISIIFVGEWNVGMCIYIILLPNGVQIAHSYESRSENKPLSCNQVKGLRIFRYVADGAIVGICYEKEITF